MKRINHMNWQYLIRHPDGKEAPINDFDSMKIGSMMDRIMENEKRILNGSDQVNQ